MYKIIFLSLCLALFPVGVMAASSASTATAVQEQGQGQSQSQYVSNSNANNFAASFSPSQTQGMTTNNALDYNPSTQNEFAVTNDRVFENSFNTKALRPLPYTDAPSVSTYGGPSSFYQPSEDPGPQFVGVDLLVKLLNSVDTTVKVSDDVVVSEQDFVYPADNADAACAVSFEIINDNMAFSNMKTLAVVSVTADDEAVNSAALAVKLADIARKVQGHKVIFVREGVRIQLTNSGWGVGFNQSAAYQGTTAGSIGGVSVGGTGYSSGKATYLKFPYLVAIITE